MSVTTILLFLLGKREAVLQIAQDRWALAIGCLLVLSAALARNYARKDLRRQPWHLAVPFAASIVTSLGLFTWIYIVAWWHGVAGVPFLTAYLSFLGLYWMTAPLAWLYALPLERWLSRTDSTKTRLALLGIVAAWRVAVIIRASYVILQANGMALACCVMIYVCVVAICAIALTSRERSDEETPPPIIELMGAITPPAPEEAHVIDQAGCAVTAAAILCCCIGGLTLLKTHASAAQWEPVPQVAAAIAPPGYDTWLLAVLPVLSGVAVLPFSQRRIVLAGRVKSLAESGDFAAATRLMSEQGPTAFPYHWDPPPCRFASSEAGPSLIDAMESTLADDSLRWVTASYRRRLEYYVLDARWYWETPQLESLGRLLGRLPDAAGLAATAVDAFTELAEYHESLLKFYGKVDDDPDEVRRLAREQGIIDPDPEQTPQRLAAIETLRQLSLADPDNDAE